MSGALAGGGGLEESPPSTSLFPILFEPPFPLVREPELWVVAAGERETWGGATVAWSEDGDWYPENAEGEIGDQAVVGTLRDHFPFGASWDTIHGVHVELPFRGKLRAGDRGSLVRQQTLIYLGNSSGTRFELLCYSEVTLVGLENEAHVYRFDGPVRRGCYGTPILTHAPGSRFARLDSQVARITLPTRLIHAKATLKLRLVAELGDEIEEPEDVDPIPYTIQGHQRSDPA
jgi:hypothetical protein